MNHLILTLLCFFSFNNLTFSQKNEFRLRINQISFQDSEEFISVDSFDLIVIPREKDKSKNYSFDLAFLKNIHNKNFIFRVGLTRINKSGIQQLARDTSYFIIKDETKNTTLRLGLGLLQNLYLKNDKILLNYGVLLDYRHTFSSHLRFINESFNSDNKLIIGREIEYQFPKSWRMGLSFDLGFYYFFLKDLAIGIENSNLFYFDRTKGSLFENRLLYNESSNILDSLFVEHIENKSSIGKSFNFSLVLLYKF